MEEASVLLSLSLFEFFFYPVKEKSPEDPVGNMKRNSEEEKDLVTSYA